MGILAQAVAAGSLFAIVATLVVALYAWNHRTTRGASLLALLALVSSFEATFYCVELFASSRWTVLFGHRIYVSALAIGAVLWLAFAAVWTDNGWLLQPRYIVPLTIPNVFVVGAIWTNVTPVSPGVHSLWWADVTTTVAAGYVLGDFAYGPLYWGWRFYSAVQFLAGVGLVAVLVVRPEHRFYRRQNVLLIVGVLFAFAINVVFQVVGSPFDPTAMGIAVANVLAVVAIYGFGFFDVVPIARRSIVEEVDSGLLVFDDSGRVIDANRAVRELLDVSDADLGRPLREVLADAPTGFVDGGSLPPDQPIGEYLDGTEFVVDGDEERSYYAVNVSELTDDQGRHIGNGVALYDVSERRRREQELELLDQVLTRVLRHNVRNDLTVIIGYARMIAEDGEETEWAENIVETADEMERITEKAREIQRVIDREPGRSAIDAVDLVDDVVGNYRDAHPDASFETDWPDEAWIWATADVDAAVENAIENAVIHNDADAPQVEVRIEAHGDVVDVVVADDGPGIPPHEVEVLERQEETPLDHGSGIGLWLISWVVDRSDGSVSFESTGTGTEVRMRFEATDPRDGRRSPGDEESLDGGGSPGEATRSGTDSALQVATDTEGLK